MTTRRIAATLLAVGVLTACDAGSEEAVATTDRSTFVAAYVDLRMAALRTGGTLDADRKQAILEEYGVSEADLLEFAEVHGGDASFMRDVWNDVEAKLDAARLMSRGAGSGDTSDREREDTGDPGGDPEREDAGDPGGDPGGDRGDGTG